MALPTSEMNVGEGLLQAEWVRAQSSGARGLWRRKETWRTPEVMEERAREAWRGSVGCTRRGSPQGQDIALELAKISDY